MISGNLFPREDFEWYLNRRRKQAERGKRRYSERWWRVGEGSGHTATIEYETTEGLAIWHFIREPGAAEGVILVLNGHRIEELPEDSLIGLMWLSGSTVILSDFPDDGILKVFLSQNWGVPGDIETLLSELRRETEVDLAVRYRIFRMAFLNSGAFEVRVIRDD